MPNRPDPPTASGPPAPAVHDAAVEPVDAWGSHRLDLDAYLRRTAAPGGPLTADAATLAAMHRRHVEAVPFENLDIVLGRGVSVDLGRVQDKLVVRSRGGYCYEHATVFAAVLEQVGFHVDRVLARTGDPLEHPRPRSHLVLLVTAPGTGERWLADVGFGSGLLRPLGLVADGPHRQGAWRYELVRGEHGRDTAWRLREDGGAGWTTVLTFTEEPQYAVDVEVANHYSSTSATSPFTQRPVVVLKDETRVWRLLGRQHTVERPGQPTSSSVLTDAQVTDLLDEVFAGALSPDELAAIVATLPPHTNEAPVAPGLPARTSPAGTATGSEDGR